MTRRPLRLQIAALAGLAALVALPAQARTFYIVQSGPQSWTVMDAGGVETIAGTTFRRAWAVRVQRNILSGDPPQPGYVRTLTEFDCDLSRTRWREFTVFSRAGATLVSKVNPNPEWAPAEEASDTYAAHRVVCEGVGGGSVVSADSVAKVVISLMAAWDAPPAAALPPIIATPPKPAAAPAPKAVPAAKPPPKTAAQKPKAPAPPRAKAKAP